MADKYLSWIESLPNLPPETEPLRRAAEIARHALIAIIQSKDLVDTVPAFDELRDVLELVSPDTALDYGIAKTRRPAL